MAEPGYLRFYGSTIRLLASRGHTVLLAYDNPGKRGEHRPLPAPESDRLQLVGAVPWKETELMRLAVDLRITADYLHYFRGPLRDSPHVRHRLDKYLPARTGFLRGLKRLPPGLAPVAVRVLRLTDRAIPADAGLVRFIRSLGPEVVIVTPGLARGPNGARQSELLKASRAIGVPVGLGIASWDHLTTKGIIRGCPDRVFVWNDAQKREAVKLHRVRSARVVVTGAQPFDEWFEHEPVITRAEFLNEVSLPVDRPYVLYVGSSRNMTPPDRELAFVRRWVSALRASGDSQLETVGVMVRPHPGNVDHWREADLSDLGPATVWPRSRGVFPRDERAELDFFHSVFYSSAVVGINTTAMIESAIVGRPVYTVQAGEFADTQQGTPHFHHLLPERGGCVKAAGNLEQHVRQLADGIHNRDGLGEEIRAFVHGFVRPHGLATPATPVLAAEIEALGDTGPTKPRTVPAVLRPLTSILGRVAGSRPRARPRRQGQRA
jgi:hypothetical protein